MYRVVDQFVRGLDTEDRKIRIKPINNGLYFRRNTIVRNCCVQNNADVCLISIEDGEIKDWRGYGIGSFQRVTREANDFIFQQGLLCIISNEPVQLDVLADRALRREELARKCPVDNHVTRMGVFVVEPNAIALGESTAF